MREHVRVRMYNVGFGDCFLLELPREQNTPFRVLVDCGAHKAGYPSEGWKPEVAVAQIIEDITEEGSDPTLDVVIATHRHQDHVSGFEAEAWRDVTVGEVWLPWTEDPKDKQAAVIRNRQSRLAHGLQLAFQQPGFNQRWSGVREGKTRIEALRALAANSLSNEAAMKTLHSGFRGNPVRRFLSTTNTKSIVAQGCENLTVHVLGPSRDPEVIRDMDPPAGQSYLRFGNGSGPAAGSAPDRPFARSFTLSPADYESVYEGGVSEEIKAAAVSMMRDDDLATAVSLDKAVNGTSLMLMFEFGEAFLLFPGDAQWGTWNAAMSDPDARELLARTTFYKVGHHGSHNATPVEFVEEVLPQDENVWGTATSVHPVGFWPEIPRKELLTELKKRSDRMVRSDKPGRSGNGVAVRSTIGVDFEVPC
ncbi:hypothetical protein Rhe02_05410 [Rhizocola hellebori]|uniref:Metallo-beta-lactamase domain-containing protein n=1 Tax=Rhizocola hellebori TaxID=1392758 RepID=A0A8J3Q2H6_9ACTN|nr:hypothetical protein [Rhizocola hellebori]GIH02474.1 hypothetical protein Rhe02_05410 [Rhizocola hellebori]